LSLKDKYALIGDVRGRGLMQGIELVIDRGTKEPAPKHTNALMETAKQVNLLIGKGGLYGNALRVAPPLSARKEHVEEALEKLDYAFGQVMEMSF
jgi:4-aminobutyrate aminotransferase-like enzyme